MAVSPVISMLTKKYAKLLGEYEFAERPVEYADAVHEDCNRHEDVAVEVALRNRVSRAAFSAAFYFQCLAVMGTKSVGVELLDYITDARSTKKGRRTSGGGTE